MKNADYRRLSAALIEDYRVALEAFARTGDNVGVYALAVEFHADYAGVGLRVNTERAFEAATAPLAPGESLQDRGVHWAGRWNPADFSHVVLRSRERTRDG